MRVTWLTRKCNFRSFRRHDSFENVIFDLSGDMTHSQNVWLVNTYRWNDSFKNEPGDSDMTHSKIWGRNDLFLMVTWLIRKGRRRQRGDIWHKRNEFTYVQSLTTRKKACIWEICYERTSSEKCVPKSSGKYVTNAMSHLHITIVWHRKSLYLRNESRTHVIREMCTQIIWKICHERKESSTYHKLNE